MQLIAVYILLLHLSAPAQSPEPCTLSELL